MIDMNCYDDCDFTFEDEVNENREFYGNKIKKICLSFNIDLINQIRELNNI